MQRHADRTPWGLVCLLFCAGIVAAAQVGKAIVSLPLMRSEMNFGFDIAAAILSVFATLGAACGIGGGALVSLVGVRRSLLLGMIGLVVGNGCAVFATGTAALVAARIIEGSGFFGIVLAIPSLLSRMATPGDRDLVMGLWSAYMPIGILAMLMLGPALPMFGWQQLWLGNAVVAGLLAIGLSRALPTTSDSGSVGISVLGIAMVLANRRCVLMAGAFFAYSFNYFALVFTLPLLLISKLDNPLGDAALFGAVAMGVSAVGHLASGPLLRSGLSIWAAIALTFAAYMLAVIGVFSAGFSTPLVVIAASLALGVGGLAPGAIYSAAPSIAPTPAILPTTVGLFQQASNLGQFAGPIATGLIIEHLGWQLVPLATVPVAVAGVSIAFAIRQQFARSRNLAAAH
jgi:MFS family permease